MKCKMVQIIVFMEWILVATKSSIVVFKLKK